MVALYFIGSFVSHSSEHTIQRRMQALKALDWISFATEFRWGKGWAQPNPCFGNPPAGQSCHYTLARMQPQWWPRTSPAKKSLLNGLISRGEFAAVQMKTVSSFFTWKSCAFQACLPYNPFFSRMYKRWMSGCTNLVNGHLREPKD